jgi:hypothetical protein
MAILRVKLQGFCGASATTLCSALSSNVSAAALLAGSSSRARDAAPERRCMMWALGLGPWSGPDFTLAQGNARRGAPPAAHQKQAPSKRRGLHVSAV